MDQIRGLISEAVQALARALRYVVSRRSGARRDPEAISSGWNFGRWLAWPDRDRRA
jgi:hypothetical protein